MTERRFSDEEVTEILRRATVPRPESRAELVHEDGMTLGQLESIAREAGIEPERVAAAAREIEAPPAAPRRAIGVPVSVSRSVELPRRISEAEWEHLVTRLRETFDAAGKLESHGSLRQWSNGNLRVMLEPGINGHRVRFTTDSAGMRMRLVGGSAIALIGLGSAFLGAIFPASGMLEATPLLGLTGILGLVVATAATRATKLWRGERRLQFDALAAELERLTQR